ncbi:hypothetical protein NQ318_001935 [Aromia moschata]|uniref:WD repeat-containing protein 63 n=1 Tax=Aromia moschata TaxID=1265417 RepID=A0AAV8Z1N2_9CUCU|nr:hypothetical protein NQ318_001935 [Aromia moschata]
MEDTPSASTVGTATQPSSTALIAAAQASVTAMLQAKQSATAAALEAKAQKKKKKKRDKKRINLFDLPGVHKIVLSEKAQKSIGSEGWAMRKFYPKVSSLMFTYCSCVAGDTVTSEKPWMFVDKEMLTDNLEFHEESSEFLPLKNEIIKYPRKQILIGYIPDESRDYDEFHICVTEQATDIVNDIIEKMKKEQEERLFNSINKVVREWVPQGTEEEVNDGIIKNNRPLIEVEVESKYPIFSSKIRFRLVNAEQRRDGYMELKCTEADAAVNVQKSRIDAYVQVAPQFIEAEAQTHCPYPKNSSTEYRYEVQGDPDKIFEKCTPSIVKYANEHMDDVADMLTVNGVINLYTDDYAALCTDPLSKKARSTAIETVKEHTLFIDVDICKGKMAADAAWHPMWTGTVAIAYADMAPNIYYNGPCNDDTVSRSVYERNPVLIWSTKDVLQPKLILETPREAYKLSFCPFDENILVGGLSNGQVIIWDIRNKLNKVEEIGGAYHGAAEVSGTHELSDGLDEEHTRLGPSEAYRCVGSKILAYHLHHRYSLSELPSGITWMSPFHEFNRQGKIEEIPEQSKSTSMQFITCSTDGTILIWDLLKKPKVERGGFKVRKLRRLSRKPSALLVDVSPFKILHLNLRPIYMLKVPKGDDKIRRTVMTGCAATYCPMKYVEVKPVKGRKTTYMDRILYKPVLQRNYSREPPQLCIHIGSVTGDCMHVAWEGQDFESGEIVNSEFTETLSMGKYHDGPVHSIDQSPKTKALLTVGGKIFAIWRDDFKDRPVLWRRSKLIYTSGQWNPFEPYMLKNQIINGDVETWIMSSSSKYPISTLTYSSEYLTFSTIHPRRLKINIYAATDRQGVFRLYDLTEDSVGAAAVESKVRAFNEFLDREVERKKEFIAWQTGWNKKYASWIQAREEAEREAIRREEEARKEKEAQQQLEEAKPERPKGPQPGDFVEMIKEHRKHELETRIRKTIITKKQLDTKELEKRREPLQKLEEENELKKRKQKKRLKEGETIFRDTVAMLFPEVVREKPIPPPNPYAGGDAPEKMAACYAEYPVIAAEAYDYIDSHPYVYEYSWKKMMEGKPARSDILLPRITHTGEKRRQSLQQFSSSHHARHAQKKLLRDLEEMAGYQSAPEPPKIIQVAREDDEDDFPFVTEGTETEPE